MKEEVLNELMVYIKQLGDFTAEQAPLVAQEILNFALFENIVTLCATYICVVVLSILFYKWWTIENRDCFDSYYNIEHPIRMFKCVSAICCVVINSIIIAHSVPVVIAIGKIGVAPRLFILEYLAKLV